MPPSTDLELVLAMDTSGDVCSVAVVRAGLLISEHTFRHGMHLSERLLDHVTAVLSDADAKPEDVELFVVGVGPGSFTGARIGVMTIKTFASVLERPVYGIDSLAAMAMAYAGVRDTIIIPMHTCRSGIVYTGFYDVSSGQPEIILEPSALTIAELAAASAAASFPTLLFTGPALARYRDDLVAALGDQSARADFGKVSYPRASDEAAIGIAKHSRGVPPDDALELVPQYVSPPPITMPKVQRVEGRG